MSFRIHDIVFDAKGRPGVVKTHDPLKGTYTIIKQGDEFEKSRNRGFINGLQVNERSKFNTIFDAVKELKEPKKRLALIQQKIQELESDPQNIRIVRYLKAELAHIMYSSGITSTEYTMDQEYID